MLRWRIRQAAEMRTVELTSHERRPQADREKKMNNFTPRGWVEGGGGGDVDRRGVLEDLS